MKSVKRFISILTLFTFAFSFVGANTTSVNALFNDADCKKIYAPYIEQMAERGIVKGVSQNTLAPDDVCTRGQFVTFLWRASGMAEAKNRETIKDLTGDIYYSSAAMWAHENGITKIYSDGSFKGEMPVDREHAAYFLYNWAKYMGKCKANTGVLLTPYSDSPQISKDCVTSFAWAISKELLFADENNMLNPKLPVTRGEVIYAAGKVMEEHVCNFSGWTDNGDGTCKRLCADNKDHVETAHHKWNKGELTKSDFKTLKGEITYTCVNCKATKTEEAQDVTAVITRAQVEDAVVSVALAYYLKNPYMQYDSTHLTDMSAYYGNLIRLNAKSSPEYATKDSNFYSVCSDYVYQCYLEALNIQAMGDANLPFGLSTSYLFRLCDNQPHTETVPTKVNEPLTEADVDACVLSWMDFDKYIKKYPSRINTFAANGVLESTSYTDYTTGLVFKDDGCEGDIHYSYYDENGNRLEPDKVRENYIYPLLETPERILRPGDIVSNQQHALLYIGGKAFLDCSGSKINTSTGEDKSEENGAIYCNTAIPGPFNWKSTYGVVALRPLEFIVGAGFDTDPGNDVVKDLTIPEKTISRIKYPAMAIDRTVDISPYGTATKNDFVTYTVEITNKTNNEFYKEWFSGVNSAGNPEVTYRNIVVTETIPENCELDETSLDNGALFKEGTITWNIKTLKPGMTTSLSYRVKVTGEIGTQIVNDKGMVDNIPSNSLVNIIGGQKLDEGSKKAFSYIASAGSNGLEKYGSDIDFAKNIYASSGKELELPSVGEIVKNLFTAKSHIPGSGGMLYGSSETPVNLYEAQTTVAESYKPVKQMLIRSFAGGRRFYVGDDKKWEFNTNCIKEFRQSYLETGDIIVYAKAKDKENPDYDFENVGVMVYDGANLLVSQKTPDSVSYEIYPPEKITPTLTKLFMTDKDIFFALRPSQLE